MIDTMRQLIAAVCTKPGNHAYFSHRVPDPGNEFVFYAQYNNEHTLMAHGAHIADYGIDRKNLGGCSSSQAPTLFEE